VAQNRRLSDDPDSAQGLRPAMETDEDSGHELEVRVRVDAARDGEPDEVEIGQDFGSAAPRRGSS